MRLALEVLPLVDVGVQIVDVGVELHAMRLVFSQIHRTIVEVVMLAPKRDRLLMQRVVLREQGIPPGHVAILAQRRDISAMVDSG